MDRWRAGGRNADGSVGVSDRLRSDMCWRRRCLSLGPGKTVHHFADECSAWHPRLMDWEGRALAVAPESVCPVYTVAYGNDGWGGYVE